MSLDGVSVCLLPCWEDSSRVLMPEEGVPGSQIDMTRHLFCVLICFSLTITQFVLKNKDARE